MNVYRSYAEARANRALIHSETYQGHEIKIFRLPAYQSDQGYSAAGTTLLIDGVSSRLTNRKPLTETEDLIRVARRRVDLLDEKHSATAPH